MGDPARGWHWVALRMVRGCFYFTLWLSFYDPWLFIQAGQFAFSEWLLGKEMVEHESAELEAE